MKVTGLFTLLYAHVEELAEVLEGVLIHGVYLCQGRHNKVHDGSPGGYWAVLLSGCRDLNLCLLTLCQSARDLARCNLQEYKTNSSISVFRSNCNKFPNW